MNKINYTARLTRKSDGVTYPAEFTAAADLATAMVVAYEQFGATHHIWTVYPSDHGRRVMWPPRPMVAAGTPPVTV